MPLDFPTFKAYAFFFFKRGQATRRQQALNPFKKRHRRGGLGQQSGDTPHFQRLLQTGSASLTLLLLWVDMTSADGPNCWGRTARQSVGLSGAGPPGSQQRPLPATGCQKGRSWSGLGAGAVLLAVSLDVHTSSPDTGG